jgi:hypothetical protein
MSKLRSFYAADCGGAAKHRPQFLEQTRLQCTPSSTASPKSRSLATNRFLKEFGYDAIQVYQRFPKVVTVMLTGQADEAAIDRAKQQANPYDCLRKPWTEEK